MVKWGKRLQSGYARSAVVVVTVVVVLIAATRRDAQPRGLPRIPQPGVALPGGAPPSPPPYVATSPPLPLAGRIRYRAARPGRLPVDGARTLDGIVLPPGAPAIDLEGIRVPMWASAGAVPDAVALAARLAAVFPRTGLWPVLWAGGIGQDPASYVEDPGRTGSIAGIDVENVLGMQWTHHDQAESVGSPGVRFTGLAHATRPRAINPFGMFSRYAADPEFDAPPYELLLIPCRRPADAVTVSGLVLGADPGDPSNPQISAVMRSWEDRFGAFVVTFGMGWFGVAVASPPTDYANAYSVTKELYALEPPEVPDASLGVNAAGLADGQRQPDFDAVTPNVWEIGWS